MACEIRYSGFDNQTQRQIVDEILSELRPLFPAWLENLQVTLYTSSSEGDDIILSFGLGTRPYLSGSLNVYYGFFDMEEDRQRAAVIHEIVHALHADILTFTRDRLIDPIKDRNEELYDYILPEYINRVEEFTQTMAFAIDRIMASGNKE